MLNRTSFCAASAAQTFDISDVKYVYSIQYTISWISCKLDKLDRYKLGAGSWMPSGAGYRLARSWMQYSVYNKLEKLDKLNKLELRQRLEKMHENFPCESLFGRRLPSFNHTNFWLAQASWNWLKIGNT